jgi:hypothetical protein
VYNFEPCTCTGGVVGSPGGDVVPSVCTAFGAVVTAGVEDFTTTFCVVSTAKDVDVVGVLVVVVELVVLVVEDAAVVVDVGAAGESVT